MFGPPPAAEQLARDMAKDMPSPYCPGRSIASCPSDMARKLEDDILQEAAAGKSREEIEQTLVARFGREKMGYAQSNAVFIFTTLAALLAVIGFVMMARKMARARASAAVEQVKTGNAGAVPSKGDGAAAREGGPSQAELDDLEEALDAIDGL